MSSVEEKMMMVQQLPMQRNNNNKMAKKLGFTGAEIKRMGKSNQKIKRRLS